MNEETKRLVLEHVIERRKTRERPKGLTNPVLRDNFQLLSQKPSLWSMAGRCKLHSENYANIVGIDKVVDEFLRICRVYLVAHGVLEVEE